MDHRDGIVATKIIEMQNADGTWGACFHSLAQPNGKTPLTTEQALRRLHHLGFTKEDAAIQKSLNYMISCLHGERSVDDYWEKTHDWNLYTQLMLSAWIKCFDPHNEWAAAFAKRWESVITRAFEMGCYNHEAYFQSYQQEFGALPRGPRELDFVDFYRVCLLVDELDENTERIFLDYLLSKPTGIYYVYNKPLYQLPAVFASKEASHYLGAIEMISRYRLAHEKLGFVIDWLESNRGRDGLWDLGPKAKDHVYLPLSDSWRSAECRKADCTERIERILQAIKLSEY